MTTPDHIRAHRHSSRHREELESSSVCGCFYCLRIFPPVDVSSWVDADFNGIGQTALCPQCMIDSVIGSDSGYPITPEFLRAMKDHWFGSA
jgi:hypothetical protein